MFKVEGLGFGVWGLGMIVGDFVVRSRFGSPQRGRVLRGGVRVLRSDKMGSALRYLDSRVHLYDGASPKIKILKLQTSNKPQTNLDPKLQTLNKPRPQTPNPKQT